MFLRQCVFYVLQIDGDNQAFNAWGVKFLLQKTKIAAVARGAEKSPNCTNFQIHSDSRPHFAA